mmetsp:Transcript_4759/g.5198  ORF Transcript_4759/g.5198 Transcript_4759/m.5198 type:complete len:118 (-) Transcript_4759:67-420(-)
MSIKIPYAGTLLFYRRLLKTMMRTFDGDVEMFHKVRLEARREILKNKDEKDEVKVQNFIFYGEEIRDFLDVNLIQGNIQPSGHYRLKVRKEHGLGATIKPPIDFDSIDIDNGPKKDK